MPFPSPTAIKGEKSTIDRICVCYKLAGYITNKRYVDGGYIQDVTVFYSAEGRQELSFPFGIL